MGSRSEDRGESGERYEIRRRIGSGGVGVVYEAFDTRLERLVAVKRLLPPEESEDVGGIGRDLKREAAALAALQHPNIVTVLDFGSDDEGFFIVMELLIGETIDATVARGALTVPDFGRFAEQVLDALAAAHGRHLLHRDLKPSNVFVVWPAPDRFQVKLLDFGLAKFAARPVLQTVDHRQSILGSVHFMAPEQFRRRPLDARTDLYQLGCLFFHVLTNRQAFEGSTTAAVMEAHLDGAPRDLGRLRPDLPEPLRRWVLWHLNRDPGGRPPSAETSLAALREIADGRPPPAMDQPEKPDPAHAPLRPTATIPVRPRTAKVPKLPEKLRVVAPVARPAAPAPVVAAPPSVPARGGAGKPRVPPAPAAGPKPAAPPPSPSPSTPVPPRSGGRGLPLWGWLSLAVAVVAAGAVAVIVALPGLLGTGGGAGPDGGTPLPEIPPIPPDLEARLVARFDAAEGVFRDAGATPADPGDPVAHWLDQAPAYGLSPAQYHVTQSADPTSRWPLWWHDALFDPPRPVLLFDGSRNLVVGRAGAGDPIDAALADGRFSVFAVCFPGDGDERQDLFGAGNAGDRALAYAAYEVGGRWHLAVERDAEPAAESASVSAAPDEGWLQIVEFRIGDRTDGLAVHRWRPNGEEMLGDPAPLPDPAPPAPNEIRLGARYHGGMGGGERFRGVLADFLLFDRPLTDLERRAVVAHLVARHELNRAPAPGP